MASIRDALRRNDPARYADTVAKVVASGKTPAGTHRPIMVNEVLEVLAPKHGEFAVDCTLGYGGHALEIIPRLLPGGRLLGLDQDPVELPKTEARLRALGFGPDVFAARRSNFAGLPQILASAMGEPLPPTGQLDLTGASESSTAGNAHHVALRSGADLILADLGVSSMQLDDPARGFSTKFDGPLDMRMNPQRGQSASALLEKIQPDALARQLEANADEPEARPLANALAGRRFNTTRELADSIRATLAGQRREDVDLTVRRVFQALRIAVNDEFSALETLLRNLPSCLNPGGRVAILTFHSGEDRRVKKAFEAGLKAGLYTEIASKVIRPALAERRANPRSASAKLRWALRS